jgi:hypothetical protein
MLPRGARGKQTVRYGVQLSPAYFPPPRSYQQEALEEMYERPELFNEGLSSLEYPLNIAEDEELEYFMGGLIRSVGRAAGASRRQWETPQRQTHGGGQATTTLSTRKKNIRADPLRLVVRVVNVFARNIAG